MKKSENKPKFYTDKFAVESALGFVKTDATEIRLGPVNMRVLVALLEQQGNVVSRAELFDTVWKNQIVSDDVLTRCISDLRALLGKHTVTDKLIETLPKRGYRWLPVVSLQSGSIEALNPATTMAVETDQAIDMIETNMVEPNNKMVLTKTKWLDYSILVTISLMVLLLISTSTLWVLDKMLQPELVRVALIPTQVTETKHAEIALEVDDLLTTQLINIQAIRFLSRSAVSSRPQNPFPYFTREFGIQWIIEGQIRHYQDKFRVTLSLVDARTATVSYSYSQDIKHPNLELEVFCETFLKQVSELVLTNQR